MTKLVFSIVPALSLAALSLAGCSDDPVSYSEPVSIDLKVKSSDVATSVISDDKSINTEQSNPYGAFIANARAALGGHDPGRIEVDEASLLLGAGSTKVTRLDEIFAGDVDLLFQMNDSNNTYPVGSGSMGAVGQGPFELDVDFDADSVTSVDFPKLLGGSFKVGLRGTAAAGFRDKGAEAELQTTLTFTAFE